MEVKIVGILPKEIIQISMIGQVVKGVHLPVFLVGELVGVICLEFYDGPKTLGELLVNSILRQFLFRLPKNKTSKKPPLIGIHHLGLEGSQQGSASNRSNKNHKG